MTLHHADLLEHAFHYGLARGIIDIETMAQILRDAAPPETPLAPRPLPLAALAWANTVWPAQVHPHDTLWLTGEAGRELLRLGPSEWARCATVADARELCLAAAILSACSLTLRERLFGDAIVHAGASTGSRWPLPGRKCSAAAGWRGTMCCLATSGGSTRRRLA